MKEEIDSVYKEYHNTVNMTLQEFVRWSKNPCSRLASLDRSPIKRNTHLLSTKKTAWGEKEVSWAKKTIAYVARAKEIPAGKPASKGCPSKATIALRNWAYNPAGKLP